MTLGSLLAFNGLVVYYLDPIERLINIQPVLQSSFVAARRIAEITDLDTEKQNSNANSPYIFKNRITMNDVSFQHGYRTTVLHDINITIRKGEKVAIVGESGSGKSTIGKLLNHYYETNDGNILIDNENMKNIELNDLRANIGYVSQDTFLFADTLVNNLLHGSNQNKSTYEIQDACSKAEALSFILKLPDQFNTMLEKEGSNLSGGQAQRVSLARTFLKDPDLYIFDEATSALDSATENRIMNNVDHLVKNGKTVIVITHKLSNVMNADVIYTLKNGEVIESGTHQELLNRQSEYYKLWKLQTKV
ncbi:ABC transporter ATP-binding protein [Staphylococcus cohnii]